MEENLLKIAKTCSFSFPAVIDCRQPVVESIPNEQKFAAFCANNFANYFFQNNVANYFKQTFPGIATNRCPTIRAAVDSSPTN